jgi:hypothetical protein
MAAKKPAKRLKKAIKQAPVKPLTENPIGVR